MHGFSELFCPVFAHSRFYPFFLAIKHSFTLDPATKPPNITNEVSSI